MWRLIDTHISALIIFTTMRNLNRNPFIIAMVACAAILVLGLAVVPMARANFFDDFKNFFTPFMSGHGSPSNSSGSLHGTSPAVPLYKPALDYENAVVEAVKKASPAVVSITVSKNVPIIEQCPYDPFPNLPPEFRQFFGDQSVAKAELRAPHRDHGAFPRRRATTPSARSSAWLSSQIASIPCFSLR